MTQRENTDVYFCVMVIQQDTTVTRLGGGFSVSRGL